MSERTLAIIKPDAVKKKVMGDILSRYEKAGLNPVAVKLMQMSRSLALLKTVITRKLKMQISKVSITRTC